MVGGVSYAAYVFSGTGTTENVITTGNLEISFAEQNNILIKDRYPETDTEGLANTDSNSQMTFTVSSNIVGNATVNYAVGLVEIKEGSTLTQDYIKINLTKNGSTASGFNATNGKTIRSFESVSFSDLITSYVIIQGSITGTQVDTYTLKAWIDESYNLPKTDTSSGNSHSVTTTSEEFSFKIKVAGTDAITSDDEEEPNIPNAPELATNMIPVTYDSEHDTWVKADSTNANNSWYNYDNKVWANAVTVTETNRATYLKDTPGTPISMDDINTMWVWIPRFSATTNTLDCSTLESSTAEEYPQCYDANLSDNDKDKLIEVFGLYGDENPEESVNKLLNGEKVEVFGETGDLLFFVNLYNEMMAPDYISITYDKFVSDRIVTGANGGTQANPGAFNIDFATENEIAHDAFTFGNLDLSGIWVAKFEPSHPTLSDVTEPDLLACTNETCENAKGIQILPNKVSLTGNNVSNFFYASRSMEQSGNLYGLISNEIDTHMMRNNEWGAVAYLTQSIYGRCTSQLECKEIGINNSGKGENNVSSITGYGAPAGSDNVEDDDEDPYAAPQSYNTSQGIDASTTGNIYGVYDMSGGSWEYVMGVYTDGSKLWSGIDSDFNSGFNGCLGEGCISEKQDGLSFPEIKYYNTYTSTMDYLNAGLQHAITETNGWYNDLNYLPVEDIPWLERGGWTNGSLSFAGIFSSSLGTGEAVIRTCNFRPVLVK